MTDGHSAADRQRESRISMQHAALLYVAVIADLDRLIVAAQRYIRPDADARSENHGADDGGGVEYVRARIDLRDALAQLVDRHASSLAGLFPAADLSRFAFTNLIRNPVD